MTYLIGPGGSGGGRPWRPGGVSPRPSLAGWQSALAAATPALPVDVVLITDSLWETGTSGPSAAQLLHRALNAAAGVLGADPLAAVSTVPIPVHAQGSGPSATSTQGTASAVATGGQGSTLTAGQVLTHVSDVPCTGWALIYRVEPGWGTMTIRDGAGGAVLDVIDCNAAASSGQLWTSGPLALGAHTLHITSSGTTRPELIMPTAGTRVRVWPAGLAGSTSADAAAPERALDLINHIDPAAVIVATGTNDDADPGGAAALVQLVRQHTGATVVQWVPYPSQALPQSELDAIVAYARTSGAWLVDASVVCDQISTIDGTHPANHGRAVMAAHVAASLGGDPIGAAIRLAGGLTAGRPPTSARLEEVGLTLGAGDTGLYRTAAAEVAMGSPLSILLNAPDGRIRTQRIKLTALASTPAGPNVVGDVALIAGKVSVCTVAGSPGTWVVVGTQS